MLDGMRAAVPAAAAYRSARQHASQSPITASATSWSRAREIIATEHCAAEMKATPPQLLAA